MSLKTQTKRWLADAIITPIHYASRAYEKLTHRRHGLRNHYYIMNIFRALSKNYLVDFSYPNPLDAKKQLKLQLDLCQNTQQWLYRSKGYYELDWIQILAQGLAESDCFVDVGSHVGVFSLTLAQAFPTKKVIAIEALPANYELLRTNIGLNRLSNVEAIPAAVALKSGKVRFYVNPINDGGGSLLPFEEYKTGGITLDAKSYKAQNADFLGFKEVETLQLDAVLTGKSVVKIDVEGSEMDVLTSAEHSFKKGLVDMVVIEVGNDQMPQVLGWFHERDFDCFTLGSRQPIQADGDWGSKISYGGRMLICLRRGKYDDVKRKIT